MTDSTTEAPRSTASAATAVRRGADPATLAAVAEPGVAAAIWVRQLDPGLAAALATCAPAKLPALRVVLPPESVAEVVADAVEGAAATAGSGAGLSAGGWGAALAADVAALAARFAGLLEVPRLQLRLDVIDTDACRRFHVDRVRARLLCTYRGQGTQFGIAPPGATPARIDSLALGEVGLFRGALWPAPEPVGLLHRSPPIAQGGETRLLLVLDAAEDIVAA